MVAAFAEHGRYLHAFGDSGNSNWRSMQYNGLGMIAVALPELKHSDEWYVAPSPSVNESIFWFIMLVINIVSEFELTFKLKYSWLPPLL